MLHCRSDDETRTDRIVHACIAIAAIALCVLMVGVQ
jgi:hypothetical protein